MTVSRAEANELGSAFRTRWLDVPTAASTAESHWERIAGSANLIQAESTTAAKQRLRSTSVAELVRADATAPERVRADTVGGASASTARLSSRPDGYRSGRINQKILCALANVDPAERPPDHVRALGLTVVDVLAMAAAISHLPWQEPLVTATDEGVTFEWWHKDRKLTVDVYKHGAAEFTKVWGPDILDDMDDGQVSVDVACLGALWAWLRR